MDDYLDAVPQQSVSSCEVETGGKSFIDVAGNVANDSDIWVTEGGVHRAVNRTASGNRVIDVAGNVARSAQVEVTDRGSMER